MKNLLTKFEAEQATDTNDDGVVAVEYIIITVAAVAVLAVAFGAFYGQVQAALEGVFTSN